jgi:hypothetical protein
MEKTVTTPEENLENFANAFERLLRSKELLDEIWGQNRGHDLTFSQDTLLRLHDFYSFDDSE